MTIGSLDEFDLGRRLQPASNQSLILRIRGATVHIAAVNADERVGVGSGFIVRIAPPARGYLPDYVLVTARHNIDGAISRNAEVRVTLQYRQFDQTKAATITIGALGWYYSRSHDVAIASVPIDTLIEAPTMDALEPSLLMRELPWLRPVESYVFGRVDVGESELTLVRTASMPSNERVRVRLENWQRSLPVLLLEGIVTPGMSGGPVLTTTGSGIIENAVIGLVHGYATPDPAIAFTADPELGPDVLRRRLLAMNRELLARRQHLVYVVPSGFIVEAISDWLRILYPDRDTALVMSE